jgi:hypothetical protein
MCWGFSFLLGNLVQFQYPLPHLRQSFPRKCICPAPRMTFSCTPSTTVPVLVDYLLKTVAVCQKQTKTVPEKPATSRLFNA